MNRKWCWISLIGWSLMLSGVGCGKKATSDAEMSRPLQNVNVVTVVNREMEEYIETIGETIADESVDLIPRVEGFLLKCHFKEGQFVNRGDLLYEIEPVIYQAQVDNANSELEKALAVQKNAEIEYDRQRGLFDQKVISQRDMDKAISVKMQADAEVGIKTALLTIAKQNLSYTRIYAPFDGWIGFSKVSEGNLVKPGISALATVVKTSPIRVQFSLHEMDLLNIIKYRRDKEGRPAIRVRFVLMNGEFFNEEGKIAFWDNRLNDVTSTFQLQAQVLNQKNNLIPGMFLRVQLSSSVLEKRLQIPQIALMSDQAGDYVYIVDSNNEVKRRTIKVGFRNATHASVVDHLKEGERVMISGLQQVRPGSKVNVTVVQDSFAESTETRQDAKNVNTEKVTGEK